MRKGPGGPGAGTAGRADEPSDDDGPVGPFPSWRWLYAAVLAWFVVVVVGLWVLTVTLDHGVP